MKKNLLLFITLLFTTISTAQDVGCDGLRYYEDVFTDIKSTKELKYGEGTTLFGNFQELFLDVYEPEGDDLEMRPVIILAFGGSFIGGERSDLEFLCEAYARKGFVAVTIDYRLFDGPLFPLPTANQMKNVVIKTASDMRAAIRYMRQDAATNNFYRIDPNQVFVGGVSAGSITAFHTAALDEEDDFPQDIQDILAENGGLEGNSSDNFEYSSEVQGIINFSGGLNDASWIDENDPPFVSIHDELDGVVPYEGGNATVFNFPIIYMEGSATCHQVADSLDVTNELKTIENSLIHVSYFSNVSKIIENVNFTSAFIADLLCPLGPTSTQEIDNSVASITAFPNPTSGLISISNASNQNLQLELYSILGRKLGTYTNTTTLDLSDQPNGIYFLTIHNPRNKATKTIKLILEN